jgi:hypothetical protein
MASLLFCLLTVAGAAFSRPSGATSALIKALIFWIQIQAEVVIMAACSVWVESGSPGVENKAPIWCPDPSLARSPRV